MNQTLQRIFSITELDGERWVWPGGEVVALSLPVPEGSGENEDAGALFLHPAGYGLLAVADGVGGSPQGAEASRLALRVLGEHVAGHDPGEGWRSAILDGMEAANRAVCELGGGAASTLTVVEIAAGWLRSYQVGDSMTLVAGQRGKVKHQSIAHGPTGYGVEAGLLDEEEALVHEHRNVVSNVLGDPAMRIEVGPRVNLAPRDTLVVGSDGLFDNMFTEEIVDVIRKGALARAAVKLRAVSHTRMFAAAPGEPSKPDDLTLILYRAPRWRP